MNVCVARSGGAILGRWTMTSDRECFVYIVLPGATEFTTAGRFRVTSRGGGSIGEFVYGRRYRERADAVEIDPVELRLSDRTYETVRMAGFFGAVRDAMPDSWGRRVIDRRTTGRVLEEFDYLLGSPDDRVGALGFGLTVEPSPADWQGNPVVDLVDLQRGADSLLEDRALPGEAGVAEAEALLRLGTSVGGARPKAVVRDGDDLWIAKFSRRDDRWNLPRVERGTLVLAETCGLAVADTRIVTVGERDVLLVRRFDRHWNGAAFRRSRMVSALTLLVADDSVTDRSRWSYLLLADEVRRLSPEPETDLRELFARMCFNAAVSNLDDHPRNHALAGLRPSKEHGRNTAREMQPDCEPKPRSRRLVAADRTWRLSPAYDLTPTPVIAQERRDLAMVCGPHGRGASRANLVSGHGRFLLSEVEAAATFERIVATVRQGWRAAMRRAGVAHADCERIASAFAYSGLTQV